MIIYYVVTNYIGYSQLSVKLLKMLQYKQLYSWYIRMLTLSIASNNCIAESQ